MSFYRSDDMEYFKIFISKESAWETMNALGKYNLVHVVPNQNVSAVRPFTQQVKRCDQCLLKIKNIQKAMQEKSIGTKREFISQQEYKSLQNLWQLHQKSSGNDDSRLQQIQAQVNKMSTYQQQLSARKNQIKQRLLFLRQNIAKVKAGQRQYGQAYFQIKSKAFQNPQHVSILGLNQLQVRSFIADGKSVISAKRTLNRITRGNSFINQVPYNQIFQSLYPGEENKSVIFIIYPAKKDSVLDRKVVKVLDNYSKNWQNYVLPQTTSNFKESMMKIEQNYSETQKMYQYTEDEDKKFLKSMFDKVQGQNITILQYYKFYLLKQKEIFSQLNQMTSHANFIDGEIYIRKDDRQEVMQLLHKVGTQTQTPTARLNQQQTNYMPTHFQMNDYRMPAQQITNTYGVPIYKQANPSFFTVITFPFMFGMMFGDIGHGFIVFMFGIYLTFQNQNSKNAIVRSIFPFRYLIVLMGFFATYCGLIYNDFFSLSLNLFQSCFDMGNATSNQPIHKDSQCVYPIGLDPAWGVSENYLNYMNSLKMKLSVIVGVIHMIVGVFVKASNTIYFGHKLQFLFQFIPQLIFLVGFFGYMDFIIIYKWLTPWQLYDPHAPSIITTLIDLPLKMGKTDNCCGGEPLWGSPGNTSQDQIQSLILVVCVLCIPVMLLPKPIIEILTKKKKEPKKVEKTERSIKPQKRMSHDSDSQRQGSQRSRKSRLFRQSSKNVPSNIVVNNQNISQSPIPMQRRSTVQIPTSQLIAETTATTSKKKRMQQDQDMQSSQIIVHQLIETIQYVLGCISNTASYLRLWALSLAHSQLSEVFFQKTIEGGLSQGRAGIPILVLAFPILAGATFGVLLCMDTMQCFLHTLRLHWVQFQNKFYKGNGFLFKPVSFKDAIKQNVAKGN